MRIGIPVALVLAIAASAVVRVAAVWEELPSLMASHFGPSGRPDANMPRNTFFWLFASIGGGTSGLMIMMPWLLERIPPSLISMPHRDYWLTPERRPQALARMGTWTAWFGVALAVFMFVVLELVLQANLRRSPLANGLFIAALIGFFVVTIGMVVALYRCFRVPRGTIS
jgi:uncharacterized membrane protein